MFPHITLAQPFPLFGEDLSKPEVISGFISSTHSFLVEWGDVKLWSHENNEYVVTRLSKGERHLSVLNEGVLDIAGIRPTYSYAPHVTLGQFVPNDGARRFASRASKCLIGALKDFLVKEVVISRKNEETGEWEIVETVALKSR